MPIIHKYELPPFLNGIVTVSRYDKWLNCKADTLHKRDLRLKRPSAVNSASRTDLQKTRYCLSLTEFIIKSATYVPIL
jgi:hypothetical protein